MRGAGTSCPQRLRSLRREPMTLASLSAGAGTGRGRGTANPRRGQHLIMAPGRPAGPGPKPPACWWRWWYFPSPGDPCPWRRRVDLPARMACALEQTAEERPSVTRCSAECSAQLPMNGVDAGNKPSSARCAKPALSDNYGLSCSLVLPVILVWSLSVLALAQNKLIFLWPPQTSYMADADAAYGATALICSHLTGYPRQPVASTLLSLCQGARTPDLRQPGEAGEAGVRAAPDFPCSAGPIAVSTRSANSCTKI